MISRWSVAVTQGRWGPEMSHKDEQRDGMLTWYWLTSTFLFLISSPTSRSGRRLLQTFATRHLHRDGVCARLCLLHQHRHSGTSWGHSGVFPLCVLMKHTWAQGSNSWFVVVKRLQTDSQVCVGLTCTHSTLSLSSPAAALSLENGAKTKPEREAPQRQEEPLVFQGPLEARPQMRHGQWSRQNTNL